MFKHITSPADVQVETALTVNSSTMSEQTLDPTRDRRTDRDQNWSVVLQLTPNDDFCLLSVSESLCGKKTENYSIANSQSNFNYICIILVFFKRLTCMFE